MPLPIAAFAAAFLCLAAAAHAQTVPMPVKCADNPLGGTITTGGVAQNGLNANGYRRTWRIKNPSTATETLYFSESGTASAASTPLAPGEGWSQPPATVPYAVVSVYALTTGHAFSITECVVQ